MYNVQKDFSMSNMRIRNMFLLVTALAVMFLLACGSDEPTVSNDEIEKFTKAIQLNPDDALAYYNRGVTYDELEQYDKAIDDYTKAIELNPDYAAAYFNRGLAYGKSEQYSKAMDDYTKAIELNPDDADAINNRKMLLEDHPELKPQSSSSKSGGSC